MASTDTATRVLDNYVGGRWTASSSTELLDVTNPASGEGLARVPLSTASELDAAVAAAREALPARRRRARPRARPSPPAAPPPCPSARGVFPPWAITSPPAARTSRAP